MTCLTFVIRMSLETDKALGDKIDQLAQNHENHKLYVEQQLKPLRIIEKAHATPVGLPSVQKGTCWTLAEQALLLMPVT